MPAALALNKGTSIMLSPQRTDMNGGPLASYVRVTDPGSGVSVDADTTRGAADAVGAPPVTDQEFVRLTIHLRDDGPHGVHTVVGDHLTGAIEIDQGEVLVPALVAYRGPQHLRSGPTQRVHTGHGADHPCGGQPTAQQGCSSCHRVPPRYRRCTRPRGAHTTS